MKNKCAACDAQTALWIWQFARPAAEAPESFVALESRTHEKPFVKVCDSCKHAFQSGDFDVRFEHKHHHYLGRDHKVTEVGITLYTGGSTTTGNMRSTVGTLIMKDSPGGFEVLALVFQPEHSTTPDLTNTFIAAPGLVEACEELERYSGQIEHHLDFSYVDRDERRAILMALARMRVHLRIAQTGDYNV